MDGVNPRRTKKDWPRGHSWLQASCALHSNNENIPTCRHPLSFSASEGFCLYSQPSSWARLMTICSRPQWCCSPPIRSTATRTWNPISMRWRQACSFFLSSRSEEHTSELQSLMRISYAVFCLKKKKKYETKNIHILPMK